jgi:hypothetical protein
VRAVVDKAKAGDMAAARIILDRLCPVRRGRPVQFSIPDETTAGGLLEAMGGVLRATAAGELTPEEAASLASVLASHRQAIETADIEARLRALEEMKDGRSEAAT